MDRRRGVHAPQRDAEQHEQAEGDLVEPVADVARQHLAAEAEQQSPGHDQHDLDDRQARLGRAHQADDDAEIDAPEGRQVRRRAVEDLPDQGGERDQRHPVLAHDGAPVGHLLGREPAQADALGLEMDLDEHAEEMQEGRHDRGDDDGLVGRFQELDHQEGRRAHDRRRDLAAGAGRRLDAGGEVRPVAQPLHHRDGERAHGHGVGDRGAGDHAEQGGAEDRDLGRAAGEAARYRHGHRQEQAAKADAHGDHAEQHEVEDIGRHHADRHAVDALAGEIEMVGELRPGRAGMDQHAGHPRAGEGVDDEAQRDQHQRPAHGAPRRLDHDQGQDRAHDDVDRVGIAGLEGDVVEDPRQVERGDDGGGEQRPIVDRHAARPPPGRAGRRQGFAVGGEDQEDQAQHQGHVDAAMRLLAQQAEARRVEMEERQRQQQAADDPGAADAERTKAHLGVELALELGRLGVIDL